MSRDERFGATSILVAMVAAAAACAVVSGCDPPPLDSRTGSGGSGGTAGVGASGGGGSTGGTDRDICASIAQPVGQLPADILILLDASGSMNDDASNATCNDGCGASSKWALAASAINGIVSETDQSTHWGLKLFADGGSSNSCNVNNTVAVPVGAGNAGAIGAAIAGRTSANGGVSNGSRTPTRAAEQMAVRYLTDLTEDNPKFILLVTDNLPNCMPGSADQAADDSPGTIQAVADARQLGIPTMVIGIATAGQPADVVLSAMAVAGGYALANSTPAYYPVTTAGELYGTLERLLPVQRDCVFSVPPPPSGPPDIGVRVNGKNVPFDPSHTNGWDFTSDAWTSVQVYGPACDEYRAAETTPVLIDFYCGDTG
jgi:hypothetical protein